MTDFLLLFLTDILLGYVPQAAGCAVCLFAVTNQRLRSRKFLLTSAIYAAIAMVIRLTYNLGLIDFGFHTIIIWMIFIFVAILYNKLPVMQSTVSILLSGILITLAEVITAVLLILTLGEESFTSIMNDTAAIGGKIMKATCGIPANLLFLVIVLVIYYILKKRRLKIALSKPSEQEEEGQE